MTMKVIKLVEAGIKRDLEIPREVALWLSETRIAKISPGTREGTYDLAVENIAGVCRFLEFQFEISPKVGMWKTMELLSYASTGRIWQNHTAAFDSAPLTVQMAEYFVKRVEAAIGFGLPKGYKRFHRVENQFRGRLNVALQARRQFMRIQPLEIETSDRTLDIAENRALLAACRTLMCFLEDEQSSSEYTHNVLARLKRAASNFVGVGELTGDIPHFKKSRLNYRYFDALQLASQILENQGFGSSSGAHVYDGIIFRMWKVFEDVVGRALTDRFGRQSVDLQTSIPLARNTSRVIKPDIVVQESGAITAALDTKYKIQVTNSDIYQAITYASVLGLDCATLVYCGPYDGEVLTVSGPNAPTVNVKFLDLNQPISKIVNDAKSLVMTP